MKVSTRCIRNFLLLAKESDRSNTIFNQMLPLSEQGIKSSWRPGGGLKEAPQLTCLRAPPRIPSASRLCGQRSAPGRHRPFLGLPRPFRKPWPYIPTPIGQAASSSPLTEEPEKRSLPEEWGPAALLRMLAGRLLGRSKGSAPQPGGARSRPARRRAGTGLAPDRAGGGGERALGLWWPEAPGPRGRRRWLRRPRPKDPPRLGLRRGRVPLPPPPGRCPVSTGPSGPGRVPGPTAWPRPRPGLPGGPEGC